MIPSAPRRAGLLLVVIATLSCPAAAQSDAALSLALDALHAPLAAMAQLQAQPQKAAAGQAQGPIAPAEVWKRILDKVKRDGLKGADSGFFTQTLTGNDGDPKLDFSRQDIIVFYRVDAQSNFTVVGVEFSLERSILTLGTIRTDYWTMLARPSGRVDQVVHKQRVDVAGADLIPGTSVVVDLADPRVQPRFDEMLKFWSTR